MPSSHGLWLAFTFLFFLFVEKNQHWLAEAYFIYLVFSHFWLLSMQVSILLWVKDRLRDLAPVALHQGLQCPLPQVCPPNTVQQREGESENLTLWEKKCKIVCTNIFVLTAFTLLLPSAGDWWVYSPGQRQELWDHDEVWKAGSKPGCKCCCHCSCKGELSGSCWTSIKM